jgi:hypothetical protein
VQAYSCFTGIFSNTEGFGEAMILHPEGGAVAYTGNGSIGFIGANAIMNDCLFQALFEAPDSLPPSLGQAFTQAKWDYYAQMGNDTLSVVQTFVFLGDPAATFVWDDPDPADTLDNSPPQITISFDSGGQQNSGGGLVANPVRFTCEAFDSTRLDTSTLMISFAHLTDARGFPVDTTWILTAGGSWPDAFTFTSFPPDSQGHRFRIVYEDTMAAGEWRLRISMSDYFLQGPGTAAADFQITNELRILDQPLNYPNPFRDQTSFVFTLTQPAQVTIKIYTVSGKLIRALIPAETDGHAGYNVVEWDGMDGRGDPLSNGAYIYKVIARQGDRQVEKVEKMVRMR